MRHCYLACLLALAVGVIAQPIDQTLALSRSMLAVKITDAPRQLTAYAPILRLFDGMISDLTNGEQQTPVTDGLSGLVANLSEPPGINEHGTLWIVILPPDVDDAGHPAEAPSFLILLPLDNPRAFRQFVEEQGGGVSVCGNTAVISMMGETPAYTDIAFDIPLASRREIVVTYFPGNMTFLDAMMEGHMPGMPAPSFFSAMMLSSRDMLAEQRRNLHHVEFGLQMLGQDLSAEMFLLPLPDSPLAMRLAAVEPQTTEVYAGYLPVNLAYCGVSGPMLEGAPGTLHNLLRMGISIMEANLSEKNRTELDQSWQHLLAQCTGGRTLGITMPPRNAQGSPTLVAVYHTTGAAQAKAAVYGFLEQLGQARLEMQGSFGEMLNFAVETGKEKVGDVPIDVIPLTLSMPMPVMPEGEAGQAPPPLINTQCRLAFVEDKMLLTAGTDGKRQMAELVPRVVNNEQGFTSGVRYEALKAFLPAKARGFEAFALLDIAYSVAGLMPPEQGNGMRQFLGVFPPQNTAIVTFQEFQPGRVRSEIRLPNEQIGFVFSMFKGLLMYQSQQRPQ